MSPADIERMAREAGLIEPEWHSIPIDKLPEFVALVEAATMERAAKIAYETWEGLSDSGGDVYGEKSAAAIRAAAKEPKP